MRRRGRTKPRSGEVAQEPSFLPHHEESLRHVTTTPFVCFSNFRTGGSTCGEPPYVVTRVRRRCKSAADLDARLGGAGRRSRCGSAEAGFRASRPLSHTGAEDPGTSDRRLSGAAPLLDRLEASWRTLVVRHSAARMEAAGCSMPADTFASAPRAVGRALQ